MGREVGVFCFSTLLSVLYSPACICLAQDSMGGEEQRNKMLLASGVYNLALAPWEMLVFIAHRFGALNANMLSPGSVGQKSRLTHLLSLVS